MWLMLKALISTITELLDSKKAAYSFLAAAFASVLHLYFDVPVETALLLASPFGLATAAQAHVDAAAAKRPQSAVTTEPADAAAATSAPTDGAAKTDG